MNHFFEESVMDTTSEQVLNETVQLLQERSVVKMDKEAMKKKLLTQATLLSAKEAGDPLYDKYVKATKVRKQCRQAIQIKYAAKGQQKMKEYLRLRQGR